MTFTTWEKLPMVILGPNIILIKPHISTSAGSLEVSIFSHFKLMTLEQWVDICNWAMEESMGFRVS